MFKFAFSFDVVQQTEENKFQVYFRIFAVHKVCQPKKCIL